MRLNHCLQLGRKMRFLNDMGLVVRGVLSVVKRLRETCRASTLVYAVGIGVIGLHGGAPTANTEEQAEQVAVDTSESTAVATVASEQEIQQMVTQLDSPQFESRSAARRR